MRPLSIRHKSVLHLWRNTTFRSASRAMRFATSIAKRYGRAGAVVRRLDLILAQREQQEVSLVYRQGDRITNLLSWTGKFVLRRDAPTTRSKRIAAQPATEVLKLPVAWQDGVSVLMPSRTGKSTAIADLVERIASRRSRIETVESIRGTVMRRPAKAASAMSVQELVTPRRIDLPVVRQRRNAPSSDSMQRGVTDVIVPRSDTRQMRGADGKKVAQPLADREVERIADRVIGSLDRRIVAQRERLGRM
jgi:hypothetical protein